MNHNPSEQKNDNNLPDYQAGNTSNLDGAVYNNSGKKDTFVADYSDKSNAPAPGYGVKSMNGLTPQQEEQQQVQQRIAASTSSDYPGVVGGTPNYAKDYTGYDTQGNPIVSPAVAQRHQIEQSLGPTCNNGEYHDLRMHLTTSTLLVSILIIPYCCGYRGKRECVCTNCKQKFPDIILSTPV